MVRPEFPDGGAYLGADEIAAFMRGLLAPWSDFAMEAEELTASGDSVVVRVHQRAVGAGSGAATSLRYFMVWTFRGEALIRMESMLTQEEALAAVGLGEGS